MSTSMHSARDGTGPVRASVRPFVPVSAHLQRAARSFEHLDAHPRHLPLEVAVNNVARPERAPRIVEGNDEAVGAYGLGVLDEPEVLEPAAVPGCPQDMDRHRP